MEIIMYAKRKEFTHNTHEQPKFRAKKAPKTPAKGTA